MRRVVLPALAMILVFAGFGFGASTEADISATSTTPYDFVAGASSASWSSGAGSLPWPGLTSDARGFALYESQVTLEDGVVHAKVLQTHPQWVDAGWIQGYYPVMTVPANARLTVTVGFIQGASVERLFSWQYAASGAQDTVRVCADYQQNVQELSESNNCKEETWTRNLPDLMVDQISCETGNHITFTLKNAGIGPLSTGWKSVADVLVDSIKKGFYRNN